MKTGKYLNAVYMYVGLVLVHGMLMHKTIGHALIGHAHSCNYPVCIRICVCMHSRAMCVASVVTPI